MSKYTKPTLQKLEQILKDINYVVRYEKGNFNSGYCIVESNKVVVINKFFDTDGRVSTILDIIESLALDENLLDEKQKVFLKNTMKGRYSNVENDDTIQQ
jgi:hypothetical protein